MMDVGQHKQQHTGAYLFIGIKNIITVSNNMYTLRNDEYGKQACSLFPFRILSVTCLFSSRRISIN